MSRASGRSYADFFPTAPSVLQEKKKLARTRQRSNGDTSNEPEGASPTDPALPAAHAARHAPPESAVREVDASTEQDDRYSPSRDPGDLLNTVGSASSLTSTGSSVFSNPGQPAMTTQNGAGAPSSELTPLTNHESSPTEHSYSPRTKTDIGAKHANGFAYSNETSKVTRQPSETLTPSATPPQIIVPARPGPGMAKGLKTVYDPELDQKLSSKDRKKVKPRFKKFGEEESNSALPPPDPRLAIPGYTSGNFELRTLSGEAKLWKCKPRVAPYMLAPYQWDPAISIGSGPPTSIVITGFDPFTPDSQIRALFGSYGEIAELENKTDPNTGIFLGICSIRYRDSRPLRGPSVAAAAAARNAEKEGNKQRIGVNTIRVERDQAGRKSKRYVDKLAQRNLDRYTRERPTEEVTKPKMVELDYTTPTLAPPPNAPKGPSGRPSTKPPEGPRSLVPPRLSSLVEQEPILTNIKRKPYLFIPHSAVPVMPTTIPHLQKRLKMYMWVQVRCDPTGYFIIFEDSKRGEDETVRCYQEKNGQSLFTYVMEMECQQYGNPNYERSPSPERVIMEKRKREEEEQMRRDEEVDLEEERKQRARDLDPVKAALEQLRTELRDKIMSDVKTRVAASALYEYLDPGRHAAKRRKLGISDPAEQQRPPTFLSIGDESSRAGQTLHRSGPTGDVRKDLLSSRLAASRSSREEQSRASENVFADERRQKRPARKVDVRSLHQRLQDLYPEEESDDEQATTLTRDSQEQESRPMSRMSSVAPVGDRDDDSVFTPRKRRRLDKEEPVRDEESGDERYIAARAALGQELLQKEPEEMSVRELKSILASLPSISKIHQRAQNEIRLRAKAKEDDHLFVVESEVQDHSIALVEDAGLLKDDRLPDIIESTEFTTTAKGKKKLKAKKKSKKQIFEEREAAKALLQAREVSTPDTAIFEDEAVEKVVEEEEEARAEVEWGVSTEAPRRTVEDELDVVLDIDGWQHLIKDLEDFDFLKLALVDTSVAELHDPNLWAYQQKEIKALNTSGTYGIVREQARIKGYYEPNPTGSARTEGVKKILEAEKSKYLPHRIKVAKARERREAEAAQGKNNPVIIAEAARLAKLASNATSRSNRVTNRTHVKDINTVKQNLGTDGQQGDAIRFNQLKKRKKLVKFDRSAIHGWGLYAEENIAMSDMIIEYVGEKVRQAVANVRELRYDKQGMGSSYLFRIDEDSVVDATKKGGIARFINHSCAPNCTAKIIRVDGTKRIVIYALKEIAKNEELTYDYKFDREMDNEDRIPCLCGSDVCKGFLN